jgi:hypothetical protein
MQQIYVLTYLFDVDLTYYNTLLELKQMLLKQPALSSVVCIFFFLFACVCAPFLPLSGTLILPTAITVAPATLVQGPAIEEGLAVPQKAERLLRLYTYCTGNSFFFFPVISSARGRSLPH